MASGGELASKTPGRDEHPSTLPCFRKRARKGTRAEATHVNDANHACALLGESAEQHAGLAPHPIAGEEDRLGHAAPQDSRHLEWLPHQRTLARTAHRPAGRDGRADVRAIMKAEGEQAARQLSRNVIVGAPPSPRRLRIYSVVAQFLHRLDHRYVHGRGSCDGRPLCLRLPEHAHLRAL